MISPVITSSVAFAKPTICGRRNIAPSAGTQPRLIQTSPMRVLRGDPEIAGDCDLAPDAHGRAVDDGDHALVHRAYGPRHALKSAVDHLADAGRRHGRQLLEERQVTARREGAARARDHHSTHDWTRGGLLEVVGQRRHGRDG